MEEELKQLKGVLRSLVVSSPSQVDVRSLLRDYRQMVGASIPVAKFGFRDPLVFLRERCNDCFLFQGPPNNPTLTLIVPETLKHIDKFVQRQKSSPSVKVKGKRRSIVGAGAQPTQQCLIAQTYMEKRHLEREAALHNGPTLRRIPDKSQQYDRGKENERLAEHERDTHNGGDTHHNSVAQNERYIQNKEADQIDHIKPNNCVSEPQTCSSSALHNFLKKRTPLFASSQDLDSDTFPTNDHSSGRHTSSSTSTSKSLLFEEVKLEILELLGNSPEGVWCKDLLKLYRERYGRELHFGRFGYTSIISLVCTLGDDVLISRPEDTGDWLLRAAAGPHAGVAGPPVGLAAPPATPRTPRAAPAAPRPPPVDVDDALPGVDFDPDVFPSDCVHYMESIPPAPLDGLGAGAMVEVVVGEVYSPSHFWLIRLGDHYNLAMEAIMDEMTAYYSSGEGAARRLALGAVRVGHYCSSLYERDWHRSLIVRLIDSDTVKVRHVDYGTVDRVSVDALKPLLRRWAALPAQALRARLAGVRPPAAGRRWPHASCARLLRAVRDRRLVANVVALDREEDILEVFLIDTSTEEDVCVGSELVRSGHADPRPDSALTTGECYLYPLFGALEAGDTPNFAEIAEYLRDGIALDYVEEYRRHVPACLPPAPLPAPPPPPSPPSSPLSSASEDSPSATSPSPPPPVALANRIPLLPISTRTSMISLDRVTKKRVNKNERSLDKCQSALESLTVSRLSVARPRSSRSQPAAAASDAASQTVSPPPPPASAPAPTAAPPAPTPPATFSAPAAAAPTTAPPSAPPVAAPPAPAPPTPAPASNGVTLSASECEIFRHLSQVDPVAAHWFMLGVLGRAGPVQLNAAAPEFRPRGPPSRPLLPPPRPLPPAPPHMYPPLQLAPGPPPAFAPQWGPPAPFPPRPPPGFCPYP